MKSIRKTWRKGFVRDWLENPTGFPLLEHYVALRWTKVVRDFENYKENMNSIYDLFWLKIGNTNPRTCILKVRRFLQVK